MTKGLRTIYFIWDGVGFQDGEAYDTEEALFKALNHASRDALVGMFDPREFCQGSTALRSDVTEILVREGYEAGLIDRDSEIVWAHLRLQLSREDAEAERADRWRDEMVQAHSMKMVG